MTSDSFDVSAYLAGFDANEMDRKYPGARQFLTGSIQDLIIRPVIFDRFADGYFLYNRFGGGRLYRRVVGAALHWCDKFMVVVSRHAISHEWVQAEVDWAIKNARIMIICRLDDSLPEQVHSALSLEASCGRVSPEMHFIDFRRNTRKAQKQLSHLLDDILARLPYPRFPNGRPGWRDAWRSGAVAGPTLKFLLRSSLGHLRQRPAWSFPRRPKPPR